MAGAQQQDTGWLAGDLLSFLRIARRCVETGTGGWPEHGQPRDRKGPSVSGGCRQSGAWSGAPAAGAGSGASLVLAEASSGWPQERICRLKHNVPIVVMDGLRPVLSEIAARFYGHPAQDMRMAGITGTNGKPV